jgi:hypothetical protein
MSTFDLWLFGLLVVCGSTCWLCCWYLGRRARADQRNFSEYIRRLLSDMGYLRCSGCGVHFDPHASNASMRGLHCSAECEVKVLERWAV